ncbi:hypothetical protein PAHAL_9G425300 [Panicum hallii]|uniref:Uncharacterized protein n=1 Tax=Panicum hallii TaxID=206008 RepID=A0A2T8I4D8_9POAL|nr:hypothetical protein PAHAL_9G425300 [Panicum hallii]
MESKPSQAKGNGLLVSAAEPRPRLCPGMTGDPDPADRAQGSGERDPRNQVGRAAGSCDVASRAVIKLIKISK